MVVVFSHEKNDSWFTQDVMLENVSGIKSPKSGFWKPATIGTARSATSPATTTISTQIRGEAERRYVYPHASRCSRAIYGP